MSVALVLLLVAVIGVGRMAIGLMQAKETLAPAGIPLAKQTLKSEEDRQTLIGQLGWQAEPKPVETVEVVIPKEFDEIYQNYNTLQKEQGLNLEKHRGKRCTRYTYVVLNHPAADGQGVRINLLVRSNKLIGGDVCSLGLDGFMHTLPFPEAQGTPYAITGNAKL